ncbi:TPA: hypothetical protein OEJ39_002007 [Escherichia coli]|nr:hypothetical protein [Escherichia coli]
MGDTFLSRCRWWVTLQKKVEVFLCVPSLEKAKDDEQKTHKPSSFKNKKHKNNELQNDDDA